MPLKNPLSARGARYVVAAIAFALVGTGCAAKDPNVVMSSPTRDPVLEDIPKPTGFQRVDARSKIFASGRFRVVQCEYTGGVAPELVRDFYEQYMPSARFTLKQWSLDDGQFNMRFESAQEVCNIRIRPEGTSTVVVIELAPQPEGPVERDVRPARPARRADG